MRPCRRLHPDAPPIAAIARPLGRQTNNVAEWTGRGAGARARDHVGRPRGRAGARFQAGGRAIARALAGEGALAPGAVAARDGAAQPDRALERAARGAREQPPGRRNGQPRPGRPGRSRPGRSRRSVAMPKSACAVPRSLRRRFARELGGPPVAARSFRRRLQARRPLRPRRAPERRLQRSPSTGRHGESRTAGLDLCDVWGAVPDVGRAAGGVPDLPGRAAVRRAGTASSGRPCRSWQPSGHRNALSASRAGPDGARDGAEDRHRAARADRADAGRQRACGTASRYVDDDDGRGAARDRRAGGHRDLAPALLQLR